MRMRSLGFGAFATPLLLPPTLLVITIVLIWLARRGGTFRLGPILTIEALIVSMTGRYVVQQDDRWSAWNAATVSQGS